MKYNYTWLILSVLWAALEGYWVGLTIEKVYPLSVCLAMIMFSALTSLSFLLVFFNEGEDK